MHIIRSLNLADHLLSRLETPDEKLKARIATLQRGVRALIHMVNVGHLQAAEFGLELISPGIDEVVIAIKDGLPPEEWPTERDLSRYDGDTIDVEAARCCEEGEKCDCCK